MEKNKKLIAQGAEAKIYLISDITSSSQPASNLARMGGNHANSEDHEKGETLISKEGDTLISSKDRGTFISSKEGNTLNGQTFIQKSRTPKAYRHPKLDSQIRKSRTKSEAKILTKALEAGINVPKVLNKTEFDLQIEFIDGDKLSEKLNSLPEKEQFEIMKKLGEQTAKLHDADVVHGDLTTSNAILKKDNVYLIDFGLGFFSKKIEDKAVDLHLIKQALEAKHYQNYGDLFENFIKGYKSKDKEEILSRLKTVEKRGRYKH